ncbi:hypothetical protein [Actinophytocola sp.]|uniref:hypothetical protein n=1 Tax=Actinophytocola sp. TaxID=1872138 RepID=UPI002ED27C09
MTAEPRSRSIRTLSELARSGYNLMRQPFTEVAFEVHHVADRPGRLLELLRDENRQACFLETMSCGANGGGVVVGTRLGDTPGSLWFRDQGSGADPRIQFTDDGGDHHFQGVARPNLTFLYETASRLEGIIALEDQPKAATHLHTVLVKKLIGELSLIASTYGKAPVLSVQCPAQRPIESNVELDPRKMPPSSSLAVRFAIALDRPSVSVRMELASRLAAYCETNGYRMWLSDTRPGHRVGNWFGIRARSDVDERRKKWLTIVDDRIGHVLPVTFVGPARVGSTHAIVSFLQQFDEVGVLGCSITALDDLAFVHLQLALQERAMVSRRFPASLARSDGENPAMHLTGLLTHFFGDAVVVHDEASALKLIDRAGDYQTLAGPVLRYVPVQRERRMAVWVSWQMTRRVEGLVTPIDALMRAWRRLCAENPAWKNELAVDPSIEYLICRDVGNSVLYGKGKLSVPYGLVRMMFPQHSTESPQAQLCVGLEDAWKSQLDSDASGTNVLGVTVAWREYWLGHWSALA